MEFKDIAMVDISEKEPVKRVATATGRIYLKESTIQIILDNGIKKGNPMIVGEIAAINSIKITPQIIPLCHQIPIKKVSFDTEIKEDYIQVYVSVTTIAQTGVEIEAIVGVTTFLNVIWDMTKYLEKDENGQYPTTKITDIHVTKKTKQQLN